MSETTRNLEDQLKSEQEVVALAAIAERLAGNPDFRKLILDEYMVYDVARLAMMSGDPILGVQERDDALRMAQSAGHLKRFLSTIYQRGKISAANIIEINANLDEIRAEEAND